MESRGKSCESRQSWKISENQRKFARERGSRRKGVLRDLLEGATRDPNRFCVEFPTWTPLLAKCARLDFFFDPYTFGCGAFAQA